MGSEWISSPRLPLQLSSQSEEEMAFEYNVCKTVLVTWILSTI